MSLFSHAPLARRALPLLMVLLLLAGALRADEPRFLTDIADLPLMPELAEIADAGLAFDKPSGRIVEAYAEGRTSRAAVQRFYAESLPQLGWRGMSDTVYRREGEELRLEFLGGDGDLVVRFSLHPL